MKWREVEYRELAKNGFCSLCGKGIVAHSEKVIVFQSIKGHMDTVHLCNECIEKIYKHYNKRKDIDNE